MKGKLIKKNILYRQQDTDIADTWTTWLGVHISKKTLILIIIVSYFYSFAILCARSNAQFSSQWRIIMNNNNDGRTHCLVSNLTVLSPCAIWIIFFLLHLCIKQYNNNCYNCLNNYYLETEVHIKSTCSKQGSKVLRTHTT